MTKTDVDKIVGEALSVSREDVTYITQYFLDTILEEMLNGESVNLRGFGVFSCKTTKDRNGWDGLRGEPIKIKGRRLPRFNFSATLKEKF